MLRRVKEVGFLHDPRYFHYKEREGEKEEEKEEKRKKKANVTLTPEICTRIESSVTNIFVLSLLFYISVLQLPLVTICSAVTVKNCERHGRELREKQ